jgi:hypothetical protein
MTRVTRRRTLRRRVGAGVCRITALRVVLGLRPWRRRVWRDDGRGRRIELPRQLGVSRRGRCGARHALRPDRVGRARDHEPASIRGPRQVARIRAWRGRLVRVGGLRPRTAHFRGRHVHARHVHARHARHGRHRTRVSGPRTSQARKATAYQRQLGKQQNDQEGGSAAELAHERTIRRSRGGAQPGLPLRDAGLSSSGVRGVRCRDGPRHMTRCLRNEGTTQCPPSVALENRRFQSFDGRVIDLSRRIE